MKLPQIFLASAFLSLTSLALAEPNDLQDDATQTSTSQKSNDCGKNVLPGNLAGGAQDSRQDNELKNDLVNVFQDHFAPNDAKAFKENEQHFLKIIDSLISKAIINEFRTPGGCRTLAEFKNKYSALFTIPPEVSAQTDEVAKWINELITLVNKYNIELGVDDNYFLDEEGNLLPVTSEIFKNIAKKLQDVLSDPTRYYTDDILKLLDNFGVNFVVVGNEGLPPPSSIFTKQGLIDFFEKFRNDYQDQWTPTNDLVWQDLDNLLVLLRNEKTPEDALLGDRVARAFYTYWIFYRVLSSQAPFGHKWKIPYASTYSRFTEKYQPLMSYEAIIAADLMDAKAEGISNQTVPVQPSQIEKFSKTTKEGQPEEFFVTTYNFLFPPEAHIALLPANAVTDFIEGKKISHNAAPKDFPEYKANDPWERTILDPTRPDTTADHREPSTPLDPTPPTASPDLTPPTESRESTPAAAPTANQETKPLPAVLELKKYSDRSSANQTFWLLQAKQDITTPENSVPFTKEVELFTKEDTDQGNISRIGQQKIYGRDIDFFIVDWHVVLRDNDGPIYISVPTKRESLKKDYIDLFVKRIQEVENKTPGTYRFFRAHFNQIKLHVGEDEHKYLSTISDIGHQMMKELSKGHKPNVQKFLKQTAPNLLMSPSMSLFLDGVRSGVELHGITENGSVQTIIKSFPHIYLDFASGTLHIFFKKTTDPATYQTSIDDFFRTITTFSSMHISLDKKVQLVSPLGHSIFVPFDISLDNKLKAIYFKRDEGLLTDSQGIQTGDEK